MPMSGALSPAGSIGDSDPLKSQRAGVRAAPKPKSRLESGSWVGRGRQAGTGLPGATSSPRVLSSGQVVGQDGLPTRLQFHQGSQVLASQTPGDLTLGSRIGRRLEGQVRVQLALRDDGGTFETESRANSRARSPGAGAWLGWVYRRQRTYGSGTQERLWLEIKQGFADRAPAAWMRAMDLPWGKHPRLGGERNPLHPSPSVLIARHSKLRCFLYPPACLRLHVLPRLPFLSLSSRQTRYSSFKTQFKCLLLQAAFPASLR